MTRRRLLAAAAAAGLSAASRAAHAADAVAATAPAPVLFVSHGGPLFLPGNEARVAELKAWGATLARPRGIVVMTPHYGTRRVGMGRVGGGVALYDLPGPIARLVPPGLEYATPPNDALAARVADLLGPAAPVVRGQRAGFDHTTWMPLRCLFPAADVPVLEIGYPYVPDAELFAMGRRLAALRREGVLFVASGQMTHNLAALDFGALPAPAPAWSREFDAWTSERLTAGAADALVDWRNKAPANDLAHPDDGGHFRVLLVALGLALEARGATAVFPVTGFDGPMSKRCVQL
ncbi:MAG: DODA-type extradiol aromatic ring-opening family dioxygenase [Polyangiaceae bacterium]